MSQGKTLSVRQAALRRFTNKMTLGVLPWIFLYQIGRKAALTATTMAGSRLATFTFFPHTRLMPTQKISTFHTRDRFDSALSVIRGRTTPARTVMLPWNTATGISEKTAPLPMEQLITIMMIRSRIAFVASTE